MQARVYTVDDREAWEAAAPAHVSVFGSVGYARVVQRHTGYPARLLVVSSDEGRVVHPFFLRPVSNLPFAAPYASYRDTLTPEYTGPMELGATTPDLQHAFVQYWNQYCEDERIVAEFAHLHPAHRHTGLLCADNVHYNRDIVVVDLTWSDSELWSHSFNDPCRNSIRRTHRDGVRVFEGQTAADVGEFHRIYTMTMERHNANARYFFRSNISGRTAKNCRKTLSSCLLNTRIGSSPQNYTSTITTRCTIFLAAWTSTIRIFAPRMRLFTQPFSGVSAKGSAVSSWAAAIDQMMASIGSRRVSRRFGSHFPSIVAYVGQHCMPTSVRHGRNTTDVRCRAMRTTSRHTACCRRATKDGRERLAVDHPFAEATRPSITQMRSGACSVLQATV